MDETRGWERLSGLLDAKVLECNRLETALGKAESRIFLLEQEAKVKDRTILSQRGHIAALEDELLRRDT